MKMAVMPFLLVALALPAAARAQDQAARTGAMSDPCAALTPMPQAMADYLAEAARARAEKRSITPPAAVVAANGEWQAKRLAEDFAGHCNYAAANAKLPPAGKGRVIFYGDSITQNWGVLDPSLFTDQVLDRGISGQTTAQMLVRFQEDVVALKPEVVVILAGINDIAGNTGPTSLAWVESNLHSMVELAKAHRIKVVLSSVLPAARFSWRPELQPADYVRTLNAGLKRYAEAQGLVFLDYYPAMAGPHGELRPELTLDGVHPNAAGYAIMRPLAQAAIRKAEAAKAAH